MPKRVNVCLGESVVSVPCVLGDIDLKVGDFCVVSRDGREHTGFVRGFTYGVSRPPAQDRDPAGSQEDDSSDENDRDSRAAGGEAAAETETSPRVLRRASSHEVRAWHFLKRRETEAIATCKEKVAKHGLDMKISRVEFDDRQRKVVFYFTADKRVDFRELVKDLAATFRARIELWQIGVRDEARRMSGIGVCGCRLCCAAWMKTFAPVSIRSAKAQDLQFSPARLSGVCGRLRCCLAYEHRQYVELGKDFPTLGSIVDTEKHGEGKVVDRNLLSRTLTIADVKGQNHTIRLADVKRVAKRAGEDKGRGVEWTLPPDEESPEVASLLMQEEGDAECGSSDGDARAAARLEDETDDEKKKAAPRQAGPEDSAAGEARSKPRRRRRGRRRSRDDKTATEAHSSGDKQPSAKAASPGDAAHPESGDAKKTRRGRRGRRSKRRAGPESQAPQTPKTP
ncbi:hypothetical protein JW916_09055 [Candidatus Sumerlaeota bacterium]|nr:hypothetical protein [Candidatus Sumerlaeota bacterium]